jgi:AAA domain
MENQTDSVEASNGVVPSAFELLERYEEWLQHLRQVPTRGAVDGKQFILDIPSEIPALWGDGKRVLWARGEGLMIYAPQGVGKTTLAQQLVNARIGVGPAEFLGYPVQRDHRPVLYLALDRPPQIARAWRRSITAEHEATVTERLIVWQGPLPFDVVKNSSMLCDLAEAAGAGMIVVDSYKNLAPNLSEEAVGHAIDRAMQECLVEGIDWVGLHHPRKSSSDNKKPNALDDVYGSTWLTAGVGSVLGVWGRAGETTVSLTHLKQPAEPVGPLQIIHDHEAGKSTAMNLGGLPPAASSKRDESRGKILAVFTAVGAGVALTLKKVVEESGLGETTVRTCLKEMVEAGLVTRQLAAGPSPDTFMLPTLKSSR